MNPNDLPPSCASWTPALPVVWSRRAVLAGCAALTVAPFAASASLSAPTGRDDASGVGRAAVSPPAELLQSWRRRPHLQGEGRLRFLGLLVYDVRLWTEGPGLAADDWTRQPLALEITYARGFDARQIAERSLGEMRRAEALPAGLGEQWLDAMIRIFPDVRQGDRLTGVHQPAGPTRFFHNGRLRGEVADAGFGPRFFGIWLGPSSSQPALREQLLGRR
ncbi:MAG: chalcone isomerase family protein [Rubrivivax sp.]